jgi:hypothetical protein
MVKIADIIFSIGENSHYGVTGADARRWVKL